MQHLAVLSQTQKGPDFWVFLCIIDVNASLFRPPFFRFLGQFGVKFGYPFWVPFLVPILGTIFDPVSGTVYKRKLMVPKAGAKMVPKTGTKI